MRANRGGDGAVTTTNALWNKMSCGSGLDADVVIREQTTAELESIVDAALAID
jgi:hypothetical protein